MRGVQVDARGHLQELQLATPLLSILCGALGGPNCGHQGSFATEVKPL